MKFIFIYIIASAFVFNAKSQSKQDLIKEIRQEFQKINTDNNLKSRKLDGEEFLDNIPDGGAELTGYFRNDSIVKIIEWAGLSYGNRTREFYFKNQKLIFVYEKFDSFISDEKSETIDQSNPKKIIRRKVLF